MRDEYRPKRELICIQGVVAEDRLLEWSVEDGWEPLCKVSGI